MARNSYEFPGTDSVVNIKTPFCEVFCPEFLNIHQSAQGKSTFNGIRIDIKIGVSTERDKQEKQEDSISQGIRLFHEIQNKLELNTGGASTNNYESVINENVNAYIIEYSGYYK